MLETEKTSLQSSTFRRTHVNAQRFGDRCDVVGMHEDYIYRLKSQNILESMNSGTDQLGDHTQRVRLLTTARNTSGKISPEYGQMLFLIHSKN